MRISRTFGTVALVSIVALAGFVAASAGHRARRAGPVRPAVARADLPQAALARQLDQVARGLVLRPRPAPPLGRGGGPFPNPQSCLVAQGPCSLRPCVVFVGDEGHALATPVAGPAAVEPQAVGPLTGSTQARGACPGGLRPPRILRASAP